MNVPLIVLVAWVVAFVVVLGHAAHWSHRVGYLEGRLKVSEERYEGLYQRYNREHSQWHASAFTVASHADIFGSGTRPPMPSRMLGWDGGYRNASGHMQPFPPEPKR